MCSGSLSLALLDNLRFVRPEKYICAGGDVMLPLELVPIEDGTDAFVRILLSWWPSSSDRMVSGIMDDVTGRLRFEIPETLASEALLKLRIEFVSLGLEESGCRADAFASTSRPDVRLLT